MSANRTATRARRHTVGAAKKAEVKDADELAETLNTDQASSPMYKGCTCATGCITVKELKIRIVV